MKSSPVGVRAEEVVAFLRPIHVEPGLSSLSEVGAVLRDIPDHTLLPRDFFDSCLSGMPSCRDILSGGDWVQIGVWKGGGALFFKAMIEDMGINKCLHLFDTFGKIPVAGLSKEKDKVFVRELGLLDAAGPSGPYRDVVERLFSDFGFSDGIRLHECDINTLPATSVPEEISFLHVDVDFYEPTFSALNIFYDKVIPGGLIIIDDYYMDLLGCKEAVDEFLAERKIDASSSLCRFSSYSAKLVKPGVS